MTTPPRSPAAAPPPRRSPARPSAPSPGSASRQDGKARYSALTDTWDFGHVTGCPRYMKQRAGQRAEFAASATRPGGTIAKEFCAALLAPGHERVRELPRAYRSPRTLQTCSLKLGEVTRWLNWLTAHGVTSLGQVTDWHCEAYAAGRAEKRDRDGNVIGQQAATMARAAEVVIDRACPVPRAVQL